MSDEDKALTIFGNLGQAEQETAIKRLISGKTPKSAIRQRKARGGDTVDYPKSYYLIRQLTLLTGGKWSQEILEETEIPDYKYLINTFSNLKKVHMIELPEGTNKDGSPKTVEKAALTIEEIVDLLNRAAKVAIQEVGCKVKITLYDKDGKVYGSQTAWGQKDVGKYTATGLPMSLIDDRKAAQTKGIAKCASYLGFSADMFGFEEDIEE